MSDETNELPGAVHKMPVIKEKDKPECRICHYNLRYHGMIGCLRAYVKGGPKNCIDFGRSKHADEC